MAVGGGSLPDDFPAYDQALNLARPLADRGQLSVPPELFGRVILDVTVSAVNLDRRLRNPDRGPNSAVVESERPRFYRLDSQSGCRYGRGFLPGRKECPSEMLSSQRDLYSPSDCCF